MSISESEQFNLLDQLAEEFAERFRRGERPALSEYTGRYPALAGEIRELFPAMVKVEQADDARQCAKENEGGTSRATNSPLEQVGDYRILRKLGRGGMGVVYEAEQVSLGRRVALKVLPRHVSGDETVQERFRREARAAGRLHHTNIVPVYEVGQDEDVRFYAMQFIQGQGLDLVIDELRMTRDRARSDATLKTAPEEEPRGNRDEHSREGEHESKPAELDVTSVAQSILSGRFDPGRQYGELAGAPQSSSSATLPGGAQLSSGESGRHAFFRSLADIGLQVAGGLAHAHARGIVHRDIKPSNLLLDTEGVVWITDFGLAKGDDQGLTQTGDFLGTLRYMAPERFRGEGDARADVYALGLTLYELLTLRPGFESSDRLELIERIKTAEPVIPRLYDPRIPRDLETIVLKAIEKDPRARYQSVDAMGEDLRRFLADLPIRARQVSGLERYWRWAKRNPGIAVLGGALAAVLLLATVSSLLAAGYFNRAAQSERAARHEGERLRQAEEAQRRRADVTLADMYTSRGLLAAERAAAAEAVLWFAAAADQSATAEDAAREENNCLRARNWMRQAILPVAALRLPSDLHQLDFQPRGDLLLVRFGNDEVRLWSWRGGKPLPWAGKLTGVLSAAFSPDGTSVALGFDSGQAQIRNAVSGEILATARHEGQISALAFSPDGRFLAIAGRSARVWDVIGRAFLGPVLRHPHQIHTVLFNKKGDRLITACADKLARVFAIERTALREEPLYEPAVHQTPESAPALVEEDRILVTVSGGSELTRRDMATGRPVMKPIQTWAWNLRGVVASPDGKWFATAGYKGAELHTADGKEAPVRLGHTNLVARFAFSPDNTMLLTVSWDQTARLWSVPGGQALGPPLAHMANAEQCAWSEDARYFVTAQNDGLIRVWRRPVDDLVIAKEPRWGARPRVSLDGRLAVPGFWHEAPFGGDHQNVKRVRVVATATGGPAGADISLPGDLVDSCVCADNVAVAAVWSRGEQGQLGVWDVATARGRFEPIALPGFPLSVAARPGSNQLAVVCSTSDLLVIDDRTGKHVLELRHEAWKEREKKVQAQYTSDGKTLVSLSGGYPATVNVRDADTGTLRCAPLRSSVDGANIHSFALSADSRLVATVALIKNAVEVWDLATGRAVSEPLPHPGDYWGLFAVRFSPDGGHLLTGHKDGQVRYWDWRAAKLACPAMAHEYEVMDVAITRDGRFALAAVSGRAAIHVWELTTGRRVAPRLQLGSVEGTWCQTLAISPDGRRALGCFPEESATQGMSMGLVDLDALVSHSTTPIADLALLAELATARRIELGDLSSLTTDQWQERWRRFQKSQ